MRVVRTGLEWWLALDDGSHAAAVTGGIDYLGNSQGARQVNFHDGSGWARWEVRRMRHAALGGIRNHCARLIDFM